MRAIFSSFLVFFLILFTSCEKEGVEISIKSIKVMQAVEGVGLIMGKNTVVRVFVETNGKIAEKVNGTLKVKNGTNTIRTESPIAKITAPAVPDISNEFNTLNFEIEGSFIQHPSLTFEVELASNGKRDDVSNNKKSISEFFNTDDIKPEIYLTEIKYNGALPITNVSGGKGEALAKSIFPLNEDDNHSLFFYQVDPQGDNNPGPPKIDAQTAALLLSYLGGIQPVISVTNGIGDSGNRFLYAFIHHNAFDPATLLSFSENNLGIGTDDPERFQSNFAHELAQMFGLDENTAIKATNKIGWDVKGNLINPNIGVSGRIKGKTKGDILNIDELTKNVWISDETYNEFRIAANLLPKDGDVNLLAKKVVIIQGVLSEDGTEIVQMNPVMRYPWLSLPSQLEKENTGDFEVKIKTNDGKFTSYFINDRDNRSGSSNYSYFDFRLPVPESREIEEIRIINRNINKEIKVIEKSTPPELTIISPKPGSVLKDNSRIVWKAIDPDTAPEDLVYNILYSNDRGESWKPIVAKTKKSTVSFSTQSLPEIQKNEIGMIRVIVGDGLNTVYEDVRELSIKKNDSLLDKIQLFFSNLFKKKKIQDNTKSTKFKKKP